MSRTLIWVSRPLRMLRYHRRRSHLARSCMRVDSSPLIRSSFACLPSAKASRGIEGPGSATKCTERSHTQLATDQENRAGYPSQSNKLQVNGNKLQASGRVLPGPPPFLLSPPSPCSRPSCPASLPSVFSKARKKQRSRPHARALFAKRQRGGKGVKRL